MKKLSLPRLEDARQQADKKVAEAAKKVNDKVIESMSNSLFENVSDLDEAQKGRIKAALDAAYKENTTGNPKNGITSEGRENIDNANKNAKNESGKRNSELNRKATGSVFEAADAFEAADKADLNKFREAYRKLNQSTFESLGKTRKQFRSLLDKSTGRGVEGLRDTYNKMNKISEDVRNNQSGDITQDQLQSYMELEQKFEFDFEEYLNENQKVD